MGEADVFGEAAMAGYSTRSGIVHKDERRGKKDGRLIERKRKDNAETQSTLSLAEKFRREVSQRRERLNTERTEFGHRDHGEEA
jgi:hypothetical protein